MVNLIDPILAHATASPERVAISGSRNWSEWTYARLVETSLRYTTLLADIGCRPGDRVLLVAPTVPEFIVAYLSIQAAGGVVVPLNTMSTADELGYVINDAGCKFAVTSNDAATTVGGVAERAGIPTLTIAPESNLELRRAAEVCQRDGEDVAALIYTSGTTGRPKGAQLTIDNVQCAIRTIGAVLGCRADDRFGTALPLFHVFGQVSVMMTTLSVGGALSLLPRFEAASMLELLRRDHLTMVAGVPTMWNAMLDAAQGESEGLSTLRVAASGGASLPSEIARNFESKFGCILLEGYGLTETTATGTFNDPVRGVRFGTVGPAMPDVEVEVRSVAGIQCDPGEVGGIYLRGGAVMKGYWNRAEDTAAVLSESGWLETGDLGVMDADGYLKIVGRTKDMIIRGGYNVYPTEVEQVLYEHPEVKEAAVVGLPDRHYGEEIVAVIARTPGSQLDDAQVFAWTRGKLSSYKVPRVVLFLDDLPKGPTGKILKRAIDLDQISP
jgi:acyl-CoA synthetase (AMP-forming)/AMP-acid ligase II